MRSSKIISTAFTLFVLGVPWSTVASTQNSSKRGACSYIQGSKRLIALELSRSENERAGPKKLPTGVNNLPQINEISEEYLDILTKYLNNPYGISPLNYAIEIQDYRSALTLVKNGLDPNKSEIVFNSIQATPLDRIFANFDRKRNYAREIAIYPNHPQYNTIKDLIQELLAHGADVNNSSAFWRAIGNSSDEVFDMLFQHKNSFDNIHPGVEDYMSLAINHRKFDRAKKIAARISDINNTNALVTAIEIRDLDMILFCIDLGADVNKRSLNGKTPLSAAGHDRRIIAILMKMGAKI